MSSPSDPADPTKVTRRAVLAGAAALAAGLSAATAWQTLKQPNQRVATYAVDRYDPAGLVDVLVRGIREFPDSVARIKGANVVLKPNLVEWNPARPVNTHPLLVAAVAEAFRKLDAAAVTVAEGPGHRRDTELLVEQSGLAAALADVGVPFVDLNADVAEQAALSANFTGYGTLPVARTVLAADFFVSVAKMKTHHWAGVTLSMKNLFGTVPGASVGWPKNPLHYGGIPNSIADLWLAIRPEFAIVDGIVGMEGDGPIRGTAVPMGVLVMGEQCPAVDATTARLMGINPHNIQYLAQVAGEGTISRFRIETIGDVLAPRAFALLPVFESLRTGGILGGE
jgi:uncharacterized protein (DUF362 family)